MRALSITPGRWRLALAAVTLASTGVVAVACGSAGGSDQTNTPQGLSGTVVGATR